MTYGNLFGVTGNGMGVAGAAAQRDAISARSAADGATRDLQFLEDRIERLSLVCMAMWTLMRDKTNLSEHDLLERVKTLDLMDGKEDGQASRSVQKCSKCGRVMSSRHQRCLYCGAERLVQSAFDAI